MEVKLKVLKGKIAGQMVPVLGPKFFIGRAEDCQLRPNSELVSRHHCVVIIDEGLVAIRDFGSKNGTYVNGERVRGEQELRAGDTLTVGPLDFEVLLDVSVGGQMKPKVQSVQEAAARTAEAAPVGDEDLDISDWIGDDVDSNALNGTEATVLDSAGTVKSHLDWTQTGTGEGEPQEEEQAHEGEDEEEEKKKKLLGPQKVVGRFEGSVKLSAESSRDAAADMLRQLFTRK